MKVRNALLLPACLLLSMCAGPTGPEQFEDAVGSRQDNEIICGRFWRVLRDPNTGFPVGTPERRRAQHLVVLDIPPPPSGGDGARCNGTLIGNSHVITARHCIDDLLGSGSTFVGARVALTDTVNATLNSGNELGAGASATQNYRFECHTYVVGNDDFVHDVAILECNRRGAGTATPERLLPGQQAGFALVHRGPISDSGDPPLYLLHYHTDNIGEGQPHRVTGAPTGRLELLVSEGRLLEDQLLTQPFQFAHDAASKAGSSGAPVYLKSDGFLIGVHSASFPSDEEDQTLCPGGFDPPDNAMNRSARLWAWILTNDDDADRVPNQSDNCPSVQNATQQDADQDGVGDLCDPDVDGDGVANASDLCPTVPNGTSAHCSDSDFALDENGQPTTTPAPDGIVDALDNCPTVFNPTQNNFDGDTYGDACDGCPFAPNASNFDFDGDGIPDDCDNCPLIENPGQEKSCGLGPEGDACRSTLCVALDAPTTEYVYEANSTGARTLSIAETVKLRYRTVGQEANPWSPHSTSQFYCAKDPANPLANKQFCQHSAGNVWFGAQRWFPMEWRLDGSACPRAPSTSYGSRGNYSTCREQYDHLRLGDESLYCGDNSLTQYTREGSPAELEWLWKCEDTAFGPPALGDECRLFDVRLAPSKNFAIDIMQGEMTFAETRVCARREIHNIELPLKPLSNCFSYSDCINKDLRKQLRRLVGFGPNGGFPPIWQPPVGPRPVGEEWRIDDFGTPFERLPQVIYAAPWTGAAWSAVPTATGSVRAFFGGTNGWDPVSTLVLGTEMGGTTYYEEWTPPGGAYPYVSPYHLGSEAGQGVIGFASTFATPSYFVSDGASGLELRSAIDDTDFIISSLAPWERAVAISADGARSFVYERSSQTLTAFENSDGNVLSTLPLPSTTKVCESLHADFGGERVVLACDSNLMMVDVDSTSIRWTRSVDGGILSPVAMDPLADSVYVRSDDEIYQYVGSSGDLVARFPVQQASHLCGTANTLTIALNGSALASGSGHFLNIYRPHTGFSPVVLERDACIDSVTLSADGRLAAWTEIESSEARIQVFDVDQGTIVYDGTSEPLEDLHWQIAFDSDGTTLRALSDAGEALIISELRVESHVPHARTDGVSWGSKELGEIYFFGGTGKSGLYMNDLWAFNVYTNRWRAIRSVDQPSVRALGKVAATRDFALLYGGFDGSSKLNDVWQYDFAKARFSRLDRGELPANTEGAFGIDDKRMMAYFFGGLDEVNVLTSRFHSMNLRTGVVTEIQYNCAGTCPRGRQGLLSVSPDSGEVLLEWALIVPGQPVERGWAWDPRANKWRTLSNGPLFQETFESGIPTSWTATGLWRSSDVRVDGSLCGSAFAGYGSAAFNSVSAACTYDVGLAQGILTSPIISLPDDRTTYLTFRHWSDTEQVAPNDARRVYVLENGQYYMLKEWVGPDSGTSTVWAAHSFGLGAWKGLNIQILFVFDSVNAAANSHRGWFIDNVEVRW